MISRLVNAMLLAALLAGCSTKSSRTAASGADDPAGVENVIHPGAFEASIGGFLGASYRVELQSDGTLLYHHNPRTFTSSPGTKTRRMKVGDDAWREFRKALDEANVWAWKKDYTDPNIMDGTQWSLRLAYPDSSVLSHGSNAFPPQQEFERFRAAVVELLDGHEFQ